MPASFVGSSFESASLVEPVLRPSWARPSSAFFVRSLASSAYDGSRSANLIRHTTVPTTITSRIRYDAARAVSVASQPGHPCSRVHRLIGSTAMVSTRASIVGATIPAAAFVPIPRATTPRMPSSTMTERGIVEAAPPGSVRGASPVGGLR